MIEDWLVDFGDLPPTSPNEDGAFGDSGFYNTLKGFDIAWDIEQHGKAMIYGLHGQRARALRALSRGHRVVAAPVGA